MSTVVAHLAEFASRPKFQCNTGWRFCRSNTTQSTVASGSICIDAKFCRLLPQAQRTAQSWNTSTGAVHVVAALTPRIKVWAVPVQCTHTRPQYHLDCYNSRSSTGRHMRQIVQVLLCVGEGARITTRMKKLSHPRLLIMHESDGSIVILTHQLTS